MLSAIVYLVSSQHSAMKNVLWERECFPRGERLPFKGMNFKGKGKVKTRFVVLIALILAFSSVGSAQSKTAISGIRGVDFLNHSYQSSVCSEDLGIARTVKVSNGKFAEAENFFNVYDDKVIYGDLNRDGSEDAAVQISCGSSAGTLRAFEVHVFTFQKGRAKLLARLDSNDVERAYKRAYPRGFVVTLAGDDAKIARGHLFVGAYTDGSNAGPKYISTFDYKWSGSRFVLVGRPSRRLNE